MNNEIFDLGKRIISQYYIKYENGVIQTKNLISHDDYLNIIKPNQKTINDLELSDKKKEAREIKIKLNYIFSDNYFTDKSPIFNANLSGYLELPLIQGGIKPCIVIKIIKSCLMIK